MISPLFWHGPLNLQSGRRSHRSRRRAPRGISQNRWCEHDVLELCWNLL